LGGSCSLWSVRFRCSPANPYISRGSRIPTNQSLSLRNTLFLFPGALWVPVLIVKGLIKKVISQQCPIIEFRCFSFFLSTTPGWSFSVCEFCFQLNNMKFSRINKFICISSAIPKNFRCLLPLIHYLRHQIFSFFFSLKIKSC
jgi:hypothetical protein